LRRSVVWAVAVIVAPMSVWAGCPPNRPCENGAPQGRPQPQAQQFRPQPQVQQFRSQPQAQEYRPQQQFRAQPQAQEYRPQQQFRSQPQAQQYRPATNFGVQARSTSGYSQHQSYGVGESYRSSPYANRSGDREPGSGMSRPRYGQSDIRSGYVAGHEQRPVREAGNGDRRAGDEIRGPVANGYSLHSHAAGGRDAAFRADADHTRLASGGADRMRGRLDHGDSGGAARSKGDARAALAQARGLPSAHQRPSRSAGGRDFVFNGRANRPFAAARYAWPRGYDYRPLGVGGYLAPIFWSPDDFVVDYDAYGVPPPERDFAWIRYGPDLLLMQLDTGEIVQVIPGVFVEEAGYAGFDSPPGFGPGRTAYSGDPDELPGDPPPPGGGAD
jgi:Ni/Co efflux regulator RcnB